MGQAGAGRRYLTVALTAPTVEGSMLDGAVQGAEAVRTIVATIRTVYGASQEFHFTGPWGRTAGSRTTSLGSTTSPLAASFWLRATPLGRRSRVVASYRPVSTVLYFSRLLREKFAGTPYAKYFLDGEL
jgi:hypothetical protein